MTTSDYPGRACPLCAAPGGQLVHTIPRLPVHSCLLMDSRDEALAVPLGALELVLCHRCGYLANRAFDETLTAYSDRYEDSQAFSATFLRYATGLAQRWVDDWSLAGATVVEIGAGRGDFSKLLADAGTGRVIAMDPTIDPARFTEDDRVQPLIQRFDTAADLPDSAGVVMRHVLEHIDDPVALLAELHRALAGRPLVPVLVEVPDTTRILSEGAFWDVYYEHCAYLTPATAGQLFAAAGFEVRALRRAYDDQYLLVEATATGTPRPARLTEPELAELAALTGDFRAAVGATMAAWSHRLEEARAAGREVTVWGAGSKGSAFLVSLDQSASTVTRVVDINPHLHGRYIAGTGHPIDPPAVLADTEGGLVVVMNPVYRAEVAAMVNELSPGTEVVALGSPPPEASPDL